MSTHDLKSQKRYWAIDMLIIGHYIQEGHILKIFTDPHYPGKTKNLIC